MPNNDIQDYERMQASLQLMNELAEGKTKGYPEFRKKVRI